MFTIRSLALLCAGLLSLSPRAATATTPSMFVQDTVRHVADTLSRSERTTIRQLEAKVWAEIDRLRRSDSSRAIALVESAAPTAFADASARTLLERARAARLVQDSALQSYTAEATQRMSARVAMGRIGPSKLISQSDNVALIDWKRGTGARITPIGSRVSSGFSQDIDETAVGMVSLPYFPGREQLWLAGGQGIARADIDERQLIHPIARGAEAYYRYETGDSISIRLPDNRVIAIRELRITARRPEWRAFVGSFWFDVGSGHLVRAVYRLAADIEVGQRSSARVNVEEPLAREYERLRDSTLRAELPPDVVTRDSAWRANGKDNPPEVPAIFKALVPPSRARIQLITTEYGLYEGRFWLPRINSMEALGEIGFMRFPLRFDEKYSYQHVNGALELPAIAATPTVPTVRRCTEVVVGVSVCENTSDSTTRAAVRLRAQGDSVERCATDSTFTRTTMTAGNTVPLVYRMPCQSERLRTSERLPDQDEKADDLFLSSYRDELRDLLGLGLQAAWSPQRPVLHFGANMARYNRVEGLSLGARVDQRLGSGYLLQASGRIGHADLHANGELSLARTNGRRTLRTTVFHRLTPVNPEWSGELSFRTSLPALLYARDDAFYMRNFGLELTDQRELATGVFDVRVFAERQWTAGDSSVRKTFALFGPDFPLNIAAQRADQAGVGLTWFRTLSTGQRHAVSATLRGEAATGTFDYGKGALEVQARRTIGALAAGLSVSGGSSFGTVPSQRLWYMGGLRTVRGQLAGAQFGDAFWLSRTEIGLQSAIARPVVFFDAGWAGSRDAFGNGALQRGAGFGASFLDGFVRTDISRGLGPRRSWRFDLYLQAPL